jgi:O-antigen ligase
VARRLLWLEPVALLAALYTFWFPSNFPNGAAVEPVDRMDWFWLLGLAVAFMGLRLIAYQRLWTRTPLDGWLLAFIGLGLLSATPDFAPYPSRGTGMLARPLLGMWLLVWCVETARTTRSPRIPLLAAAGLALLVGFIALSASQWQMDKSGDFETIIDALPRVNGFVIAGGFNPNEIAGAMAWLAPLMAGLVFLPLVARPTWPPLLRVLPNALAGLAFALLMLALMLGQSRFALAGVLAALVGMALIGVPAGRLRYAALAGLAALIVLQGAITFNLLPREDGGSGDAAPATGLSGRDERTFNQRFDMWSSAAEMLADHPLTGVGMNRFRYGPVRQAYPVPGFDIPYADADPATFTPRIIPHAHNEFVQAATDLGIPGLIVFTAWYAAAGWMLWMTWRRGDRTAQVVAAAVGGGLLAHMVYGMGDAVTLWDRFSFVFWLLLGLAAAQYVLAREVEEAKTEPAAKREVA